MTGSTTTVLELAPQLVYVATVGIAPFVALAWGGLVLLGPGVLGSLGVLLRRRLS